MKHDVIVIGGGPSGLYAASQVARKGLDVLVLEKKEEIGKNVICAGIVGHDVFREFDLPLNSILTKLKKMKVTSPFGDSCMYEHTSPFAAVVNRENFDKDLKKVALGKGAKIQLGIEVNDISVDKDSVKITTKHQGEYTQLYSAKMVLIATGINYKLHKKLGFGFPRDFLYGAQAEFDLDDVDYTQVFLGKDIAQGAFAWLVPATENRVRIGLMTEKEPETSFALLLEKFYPNKIILRDRDRIQFKVIAQGLVSKTYGDRILAIGEAAGHVKTTTGGGIYFGLLGAGIASEVVEKSFEQGNFSAHFLSEYEKLWKKTIQKEIIIGYYARKIWAKLNNNQIEKMFELAKNDGVIPFIRENGDFNWHSEFILTFMRKAPFSHFFRK